MGCKKAARTRLCLFGLDWVWGTSSLGLARLISTSATHAHASACRVSTHQSQLDHSMDSSSAFLPGEMYWWEMPKSYMSHKSPQPRLPTTHNTNTNQSLLNHFPHTIVLVISSVHLHSGCGVFTGRRNTFSTLLGAGRWEGVGWQRQLAVKGFGQDWVRGLGVCFPERQQERARPGQRPSGITNRPRGLSLLESAHSTYDTSFCLCWT